MYFINKIRISNPKVYYYNYIIEFLAYFKNLTNNFNEIKKWHDYLI